VLDPDGCLARFGLQPAERKNGREEELGAGVQQQMILSSIAVIKAIAVILDEGLVRALTTSRLMGVILSDSEGSAFAVAKTKVVRDASKQQILRRAPE
jgi:hypothetical protein